MDQYTCPMCSKSVNENDKNTINNNNLFFHKACFKLGQQIIQLKNKNSRMYNEFAKRLESCREKKLKILQQGS